MIVFFWCGCIRVGRDWGTDVFADWSTFVYAKMLIVTAISLEQQFKYDLLYADGKQSYYFHLKSM